MEDQVADHESAAANASELARQSSAADLQRQRQALELQKERILDERTSSPHRRAALAAALADIEARLSALS